MFRPATPTHNPPPGKPVRSKEHEKLCRQAARPIGRGTPVEQWRASRCRRPRYRGRRYPRRHRERLRSPRGIACATTSGIARFIYWQRAVALLQPNESGAPLLEVCLRGHYDSLRSVIAFRMCVCSRADGLKVSRASGASYGGSGRVEVHALKKPAPSASNGIISGVRLRNGVAGLLTGITARRKFFFRHFASGPLCLKLGHVCSLRETDFRYARGNRIPGSLQD